LIVSGTLCFLEVVDDGQSPKILFFQIKSIISTLAHLVWIRVFKIHGPIIVTGTAALKYINVEM
jgi:hypothetical protein